MFKKRDIIIIIVLFLATSAAIIFWVFNRESFVVGDTKAFIDYNSKTIFVSLPHGSSAIQPVSFNFPYRNDRVYIKRISSGPDILKNPIEEKLISTSSHDFGSYISHSKIIIKSGDSDTEYDLWVTTGEVPVINITTEEDILNEPKIKCSISILSARAGFMKDGIAGEIELIDISDSIPRDSYSLNIREDVITGDTPRMLDFENIKRYKLQASYLDRSFLREKLTYEIYKSLSDNNIAPDGRFVELFENDSYKGLYILFERPDRDMFSLSNYREGDGLHSVLYETSNWRADFTRGTEGFSQIEPDIDNDGFYFEPLIGFEDFVVKTNKEKFFNNVEHFVDMENIIDNHILFLLSGCTNKLASNNYIYRGNNQTDKFAFIPGSLYELSFGIKTDTLEKIEPEFMSYGTMLFNRLYEDEGYRERLKTRWKDLRKEILSLGNIYSLIDENILSIDDAWARNNSKWPEVPDNFKYGQSLIREIDDMKDFIRDRIEFLDSYINYPPLIKIGDNYAKIDEESGTIFCSLPVGSNAVQKINWYFSSDCDVYLERLPVSSTPMGKYIIQKSNSSDYDHYRELIEKSKNTGDITVYLDKPSENEIINNGLQMAGWAVKEVGRGETGIEYICLFDGPVISSETFLGKAETGLPREDVEAYFNDPSYRNSGFEINLYTPFLENGLHELYLYAFDEYGNYTIKTINIKINNDHDLVREIKNREAGLMQKLVNGGDYDFLEYIFHGRLVLEEDGREKEYDLYVTTSDIPVAIIYTGSDPIPNNQKIEANLQVLVHDSDKNNFIDSIIFDFYGNIGIELRGQTSLNFPKKQYSIEVRDENGQDKEVSLLGMPSESDWILGAPYSDKTLMRNVLAFEISNEMGMYAPRTSFVEVFLDMSDENKTDVDYSGIYFLTERIKRSKDRVDVKKMDSDDDLELSGGYILEISSEDKIEPGDSFIETQRGRKLINIYPKGDSITLRQKTYITDYINRFEQALYNDYFDDDELGYRQYIDVDSFVDYLIINELFKNVEIFTSSTFLYKERYGKLKAGPVWDFNLSTGNATYWENSSVNQPTNWQHLTGNWKERFFDDDYFVNKYIDRWKQLRENVLSDENIIKLIDDNEILLSEAQVRNFNRWDILGKYVWPNPEPYAGTYKEEVKRLKDWLVARTEWIDKNIDSLRYR